MSIRGILGGGEDRRGLLGEVGLVRWIFSESVCSSSLSSENSSSERPRKVSVRLFFC